MGGCAGDRPDQIRDYVGQLTPVLLRADTRVTNHGFANGKATTLQSVLQAGTAVLIDKFGAPRVRCECGNPLLEPRRPSTRHYIGQRWDWFNQLNVIVVEDHGDDQHLHSLRLGLRLLFRPTPRPPGRFPAVPAATTHMCVVNSIARLRRPGRRTAGTTAGRAAPGATVSGEPILATG